MIVDEDDVTEDGVDEEDDEEDVDMDVEGVNDSEVEDVEDVEEIKEDEEEETEEEGEELLELVIDEKLNDVNDTEAMLVDEVVCETKDLLDVDEEREDEASPEEDTILDDIKVCDELIVLMEERELDIADELDDDDCAKNCACIVDIHELSLIHI